MFKACLPLSLSLLALASTRSAAQSVRGPFRSDEGLLATLWMQRSPEYRASCRSAYALAKLRLVAALKDPSWTACLEQEGKVDAIPEGAAPAVILDLDETVLDNSPYQARLILDAKTFERESWAKWVLEEQAEALPGALAFCRDARKKGVRVFFVSNRSPKRLEATQRNLLALGFESAKDASSLLLRTGASDKKARRRSVAAKHRVLLLIGDNQSDFSSEFRGKSGQAMRSIGEKYREYWGHRWILIPNPSYGSWMSPFRKRGSSEVRLAGLREGLLPQRQKARPSRPAALLAGPMNAWASIREAAVWVQARAGTRLALRYWPQERRGSAILSKEMRARPDRDGIVVFTLTNLDEGTHYAYEILVNGEAVTLPYPCQVQTQSIWRYRKDPPELRVAIGSCLYINDAPSDRPGKPYGGDYQILGHIAKAQPDLMLWLGDNLYYREVDWLTEEGMRRRYRYSRSFGPLQSLLACTQHYAIWDDHDYGPNNSDRSFMLKDASLRCFNDYWPALQRGERENAGTYMRFTWSDVEFFLLDNRYHRSPNVAPESPEKRMFGKKQMAWLKDSLRNSRAQFKVIAAGNQMVNEMAFFEAFKHFEHERQELFDFIVREKIAGVVFLSGDRHAGELLKYQHPGASYPFYDFTSSPLGSGAGRWEPEAKNPNRVPGTWITGKRNYGMLRFHGPAKKRRLEFSAFDAEGKRLWRHEIKAKELRAN